MEAVTKPTARMIRWIMVGSFIRECWIRFQRSGRLARCCDWGTSVAYAGSSNKRCSLSGERVGNSRKLESYSCHDRSHNVGGTGFDGGTACGVGKRAGRCSRCVPRLAESAWGKRTTGHLLGWQRPVCRSCRRGLAGRSLAEFLVQRLRRSYRRLPRWMPFRRFFWQVCLRTRWQPMSCRWPRRPRRRKAF